MRRKRPISWTVPAAAVAVAVLSMLLGGPARAESQEGIELYGKPLRGLSAIALEELVKNPDQFRDRTIRVTGKAGGGGGLVTITEGAASLAIKTDGTFALPEKLDGARVTAEGRVRIEKGSGPIFAATGVEVRR
jgi:hypothetical protein